MDRFFDSSSDENETAKKVDSDNEDSVGNDDDEDEGDIAGQTPRDRLREIGETFELPKTGLIRPKREVSSRYACHLQSH